MFKSSLKIKPFSTWRAPCQRIKNIAPNKKTKIKVIKTPFYTAQPHHIIQNSDLKIGSYTWITRDKNDDSYHIGNTGLCYRSFHIEDNRHLINFDASCFEVVSEHEYATGVLSVRDIVFHVRMINI